MNNEEKANKIFVLLNDKLPHPWTNLNPFNLKEAMRKPLTDHEALNIEFEEGKLPLNPIFPFSIINKHVQKLKADPSRKRDHKDSYIFYSKIDDDKDETLSIMETDFLGDFCRNQVVNKTKRRAELFFKCLVKLSKECTFEFDTYDSEQQIIKKSRIFLIGGPGTGKTTFLNYLISVYAFDLAVKNNAMVIRLDLNDAIKLNTNFRNLIEKRFYEVFRFWFYPRGIFPFELDDLRTHIAKRRKINLRKMGDKNLKSVDKAITDFVKGNTNIDKAFLSDMMDFLNEKLKVSFIFFIDGLDYITLDEIHDAKFKSWLRQLDNYILTRDAYKGSYLITMRDISFQRALQSRSGGTHEIWQAAKTVSVKQCNFQEMISKKLELAKKEIRRNIDRYRDGKKPEYSVYSWILDEVAENICQEYLAFIAFPFIKESKKIFSELNHYPDLKSKIINKGLAKLEEITIGNYRCVMRNLNYLLGYFSRSYGRHIDQVERSFKKSLPERLIMIHGRSYLVLRTFIVGMYENVEYRTPYNYRLKKGSGNAIVFKKAGQRFVVPPITNFVFSDQGEIIRQYRGLFKIRLLQFLNNNESTMSISNLLDCFNNHFGYINNEHLQADIEEMLYSQLISVTDMGGYLEGEDCNIEITKLGKFVLNEMISWFVYYETTIDALPMPESIAKTLKPLNYYWAKTKSLNNYVLQKACSVMIFSIF